MFMIFFFVDQKNITETRGPKVSKNGFVCFCMWNINFSSNLHGFISL